MRYKRGINTLIADAGYDVSWTRMDGREFHQYLDPSDPMSGQDTFEPGASEEFPWLSRGASIILNINTNTTRPILLADNFRNLLLIQNNSFASGTDTPYNLYVSLDGPVVGFGAPTFITQYSWRLKPDVALVLDTRIFNNAIYIMFADAVGATAQANGVCSYGRTQNSPPLPPGAVAAVMAAQQQGIVGAALADPNGPHGGGALTPQWALRT